MSTPWRDAAQALVADLRLAFGDRLLSVLAYGPQVEQRGDGPLSCLALVQTLGIDDLEACSRMAARWERRGLAIPLILPARELERSLDAFPLEYSEIARAHAPVFGSDPFERLAIAREDVRRACESQIKSHLLHLRQGFIQAAGRPHEVAALVTASAPAFAALLRNVGRLETPDHAAATRAGARAAELPDAVVADVLALEQRHALPTTDAARLFPAYLGAVEQLARAVDAWRA